MNLEMDWTRRSVLLVLSVVTLLCWEAMPASAADAVPAPPKTHKVLSCNIRVPLEEDAAAGNGWDARRKMCADVIAAQHGDIVCLQEATAEQLAFLKEKWPRYDSFALSNPTPEFRPNNAILYDRERYELLSSGGLWLSETPHVAGSKSWDSEAVRFANWVHLRERATSRELRVWNTHLDHLGHTARAEQARVLVEAISVMDAAGVPQVLVGDMNAHATHPAIVTLKDGGFNDTYGVVHGPADPGHTFHGFLGAKRYEGSDDPTPGRKIDWIFTRGGVKTHAAEIIRDGREGRYPSDHYFVSAHVSLPE
jgi:endonuclease/exonuclease/phosphatase family metal-dependent hydrolase